MQNMQMSVSGYKLFLFFQQIFKQTDFVDL